MLFDTLVFLEALLAFGALYTGMLDATPLWWSLVAYVLGTVMRDGRDAYTTLALDLVPISAPIYTMCVLLFNPRTLMRIGLGLAPFTFCLTLLLAGNLTIKTKRVRHNGNIAYRSSLR